MFDIIIIGAGPAGLTAAVYAIRSGKTVLVLEKNAVGGQILHSPKIENYPGIPSVSGKDFIRNLYKQAVSLGARVEMEDVEGIRLENDVKIVTTNKGEYEGRAVIIAAGAVPKKLKVPGENLFAGDGVSYCAVCDGTHYKKKKVAVIGGGNSGLLEALLLADYCSKVTIVQNLEQLTGESKLAKLLLARDNVQVIYDTVVESIERSGALTVHLVNPTTNESSAIHVDGVFVAIGQQPENEPFRSVVDLDRAGYICADEECRTKIPGIFVAGDCRTKRVRQITTATADGTTSAIMAVEYINNYNGEA